MPNNQTQWIFPVICYSAVMSAVMNTYARFPVTLVSGEGSRVRDDNGKEYLDFIAGIAVNTLGHAHPKLTAALAEQAGTMLHCSNLFHIPKQQQLAEKLCELSGLGSAFFCNSGAEANEAAIKLVRKYFYDKDSPRRTVITAKNPLRLIIWQPRMVDQSIHVFAVLVSSASPNKALP